MTALALSALVLEWNRQWYRCWIISSVAMHIDETSFLKFDGLGRELKPISIYGM